MNNKNKEITRPLTTRGRWRQFQRDWRNWWIRKLPIPIPYWRGWSSKRFIDGLPYGKVSFETLTTLTEKAMEADPKTAFVLLNYATAQELHLQNHS